MSDEKVEITLLTTNKTGILAKIMMTSAKHGLMVFKNHSDKIDENSSRFSIIFNGTIKTSPDELTQALEAVPDILSVESISANQAANPIQADVSEPQNNSTTPEAQSTTPTSQSTDLRAIDVISPEALKIAEDKLSNIIGPVAPMLVESAASETKHIGDLFLLLAKDLENEEEKKDFLSVVSGLN